MTEKDKEDKTNKIFSNTTDEIYKRVPIEIRGEIDDFFAIKKMTEYLIDKNEFYHCHLDEMFWLNCNDSRCAYFLYARDFVDKNSEYLNFILDRILRIKEKHDLREFPFLDEEEFE